MSSAAERAKDELCDVDMEEFFSDDNEFDAMPDVQIQTPERSNTFQPLFNGSVTEEDPVLLLRNFYQHFFPYKPFFSWLNYDTVPGKNFTHREFSFTLASDIYIRYNSFDDIQSFKKEIERLQPVKMDVGAVYSVQPKNKKTVNEKAFRPLERELVFDIDMTDYDEIRTCCSGADICRKCWEFMTIAIKVIDVSLREDFGFKHLLWVYSGRRGVHCWVCDERARKLSNDGRKAIVNFLEVVKGGADATRKVKLPLTLHPSLKRSLDIVKPYFVPLLLEDQGILDTPESWEKVTAIIPDAGIKNYLNSTWSKNPSRSGTEKWKDLRSQLEDKKKWDNETLARDILFQYTYPRLDDKVSTQINHLLKSPFCVHPKTQRVCVPINAESCESFDPFSVPTLSQLNQELNQYNMKNKDDQRRIPDYKKTSLRPYVEIFEKFVNGLLLETQRGKRDDAQTSMEF